MSFQFDIEAAKKLPKLSPEDSKELAARYKEDTGLMKFKKNWARWTKDRYTKKQLRKLIMNNIIEFILVSAIFEAVPVACLGLICLAMYYPTISLWIISAVMIVVLLYSIIRGVKELIHDLDYPIIDDDGRIIE